MNWYRWVTYRSYLSVKGRQNRMPMEVSLGRRGCCALMRGLSKRPGKSVYLMTAGPCIILVQEI